MANVLDPPLIEGDIPLFKIALPDLQTGPIIAASPHSGQAFPSSLQPLLAVSESDIRQQMEDIYVDQLFESMQDLEIPFITSNITRAYVDLNRASDELDPEIITGELPSNTNTQSTRVQAGHGVIPRRLNNGKNIYKNQLPVEAVIQRIENCHRPYHAAVTELIHRTQKRFGKCILIDCHSMASCYSDVEISADIVLGDNFGTSCDLATIQTLFQLFEEAGFKVARNEPFAGGYTTQHYANPEKGVQVLQIEINRRLYIEGETLHKSEQFSKLQTQIKQILQQLTTIL